MKHNTCTYNKKNMIQVHVIKHDTFTVYMYDNTYTCNKHDTFTMYMYM